MSKCIRCGRQYNEPADEQGDHDCPGCGLTPERQGTINLTPEDDYYWNEMDEQSHDGLVGWNIGDQ